MPISLYSPIAYANGAKFVIFLDLVWLSLVVVNHANFTVLAQGLGELCEICSAHGQLLSFGCFCNRLPNTAVSLKVNRHFVSYDNSRLNYSSRLSHE